MIVGNTTIIKTFAKKNTITIKESIKEVVSTSIVYIDSYTN